MRRLNSNFAEVAQNNERRPVLVLIAKMDRTSCWLKSPLVQGAGTQNLGRSSHGEPGCLSECQQANGMRAARPCAVWESQHLPEHHQLDFRWGLVFFELTLEGRGNEVGVVSCRWQCWEYSRRSSKKRNLGFHCIYAKIQYLAGIWKAALIYIFNL